MTRQTTGLLAACIVFVLAAAFVFAQTTAPPRQQPMPAQAGSGEAEQQVRQAHQRFLEAGQAGDFEAGKRLMTDDATWVTPEGKVASRDELGSARPNAPREVNLDHVKVVGDSAILSGSAHFESGREVRFLQHWVNRGGQWMLSAHQAVLPASASAPAGAPAAVGTTGGAIRKAKPELRTADERALWKVHEDMHRAFLKGDAAAYARLTNDNYVRINADGQRVGKSEFLDTVKNNASQSPGNVQSGDVEITVHGNWARMISTTWGTLPGGQVVPPSRATRLFVKQGGRWQQAAAIFTPIAQQ